MNGRQWDQKVKDHTKYGTRWLSIGVLDSKEFSNINFIQ